MDTIIATYTALPVTVRLWLKIGSFFIIAWVVSRILSIFSKRLIRLAGLATHGSRTERLDTLTGLVQGIISVLAFSTAVFFSLGQFIDPTTLVWMIGLFGAGFGLSARPLISDVMAGTSFIFEDTFSVGEKVELLEIEGVIEAITLRTTWLRAPSGELFTIPNGDIRIVRNFSRGRYSPANVTLKINTTDLNRAIVLLEKLGHQAMDTLPNLIEPWQLISETGLISQRTELTLIAKARFGKAADMRPRLLAMIQDALAEAQISLSE